MSGLPYTQWPLHTWKLTALNGCNVSGDDDTVRFTVSGTKVEVAIFLNSVETHQDGYPKTFTGDGGKACNAESEITSSKADDGSFRLECTPKPGFEPATWTAREQ